MKIERELWFGMPLVISPDRPYDIQGGYVKGSLMIVANKCFICLEDGILLDLSDRYSARINLIEVMPESLEKIVNIVEIGGKND